jgi:hypothetical protein
MVGLAVTSLTFGAFFGAIAYGAHHSVQILMTQPTTLGRISSIDVQRTYVRLFSSTALEPTWVVTVAYSYVVDGKTYEGHDLSNHPPMKSADVYTAPPAELLAYKTRYPVGSDVVVHYNPKWPDRAMLEIDSRGARMYARLAAVLLAVGVLCALALLRMYTFT